MIGSFAKICSSISQNRRTTMRMLSLAFLIQCFFLCSSASADLITFHVWEDGADVKATAIGEIYDLGVAATTSDATGINSSQVFLNTGSLANRGVDLSGIFSFSAAATFADVSQNLGLALNGNILLYADSQLTHDGSSVAVFQNEDFASLSISPTVDQVFTYGSGAHSVALTFTAPSSVPESSAAMFVTILVGGTCLRRSNRSIA